MMEFSSSNPLVAFTEQNLSGIVTTEFPGSSQAVAYDQSQSMFKNPLKHCRSGFDIDLELRNGGKLGGMDCVDERQAHLRILSSGALLSSNFLLSNGCLEASSSNSAAPAMLVNRHRLSSLMDLPSLIRSSGFPVLIANHGSLMTLGQRHELDLQYLIAKYLMSGLHVPVDLLAAFRTTFLSIRSVVPFHLGSSLGWGAFQMGYHNNMDPEPGRCRRTDGKKWRCGREVVPDQKYCERHIHRGKNRRKAIVTQTSASTLAFKNNEQQQPRPTCVRASTQLSISIPSSSTTSASNSSNATSPARISSPLKLSISMSGEEEGSLLSSIHPITHMRLGTDMSLNTCSSKDKLGEELGHTRQLYDSSSNNNNTASNWMTMMMMPIPGGMQERVVAGGPLAEMLQHHNTNSTNKSAFYDDNMLMWDKTIATNPYEEPNPCSSPCGVLHKTIFGSLSSDSSTASSPPREGPPAPTQTHVAISSTTSSSSSSLTQFASPLALNEEEALLFGNKSAKLASDPAFLLKIWDG